MNLIVMDKMAFLGLPTMFQILNPFCLVDYAILINWTSHFSFERCLMYIYAFHINSILNRNAYKQTVLTMISRRFAHAK